MRSPQGNARLDLDAATRTAANLQAAAEQFRALAHTLPNSHEHGQRKGSSGDAQGMQAHPGRPRENQY
jgi:hypothetical protein